MSGNTSRSVSHFSRQLIMMTDICGCQNLLGAERGGRAPAPRQHRHIGPETGTTPTYLRLILSSWVFKTRHRLSLLHLSLKMTLSVNESIVLFSHYHSEAAGFLQELDCLKCSNLNSLTARESFIPNWNLI